MFLKEHLSKKIPEILRVYIKEVTDFERKHGDGKNALLKLDQNIEVFDIQFAFNNHSLIEKLKVRGTHITNLDFDKVKEVEEQIEAMITDEKQHDNFMKPVCAFVTFVRDDHKTIALSYAEKMKMYENNPDVNLTKELILNQDPEFKETTQPTNIIWEHRHIKGINYKLRVLSAFIVITFMLSLSFVVIFLVKKKQILNS